MIEEGELAEGGGRIRGGAGGEEVRKGAPSSDGGANECDLGGGEKRRASGKSDPFAVLLIQPRVVCTVT